MALGTPIVEVAFATDPADPPVWTDVSDRVRALSTSRGRQHELDRYEAGTAVVVLGSLLRLPTALAAIAGASLCFVLRYLAIRRGWRLPVAEHPSRRADDREPPRR